MSDPHSTRINTVSTNRQRVSGRDPGTRYEVAARIHFHDRYAAQRGGEIEFYASLPEHEKRFIRDMVREIVAAPESEHAND